MYSYLRRKNFEREQLAVAVINTYADAMSGRKKSSKTKPPVTVKGDQFLDLMKKRKPEDDK